MPAKICQNKSSVRLMLCWLQNISLVSSKEPLTKLRSNCLRRAGKLYNQILICLKSFQKHVLANYVAAIEKDYKPTAANLSGLFSCNTLSQNQALPISVFIGLVQCSAFWWWIPKLFSLVSCSPTFQNMCLCTVQTAQLYARAIFPAEKWLTAAWCRTPADCWQLVCVCVHARQIPKLGNIQITIKIRHQWLERKKNQYTKSWL